MYNLHRKTLPIKVAVGCLCYKLLSTCTTPFNVNSSLQVFDEMREYRIIFVLIICTYAELSTASIGRFLPFSGFYPIPSKTPEPINVFIPLTYPLFTTKQLTFTGNNGIEDAFIRNTGFSVQVFLQNSTTTNTALGGPLYGNVYRYRKTIFFWGNSTDDVAYTTVNGKNGFPLEVAVIYVNLKYGPLTNAVRYRDGVITALFRIQVGPKSNPKFEPLAAALKQIRKPGPLIPIKLLDAFQFFRDLPANTGYFVYPGSYTEESTGETYYCTTTVVTVPNSNQFISKKQFKDTFLALVNNEGNPLINQEQQHRRGLRPVARSQNIKLKFTTKTVYHST